MVSHNFKFYYINFRSYRLKLKEEELISATVSNQSPTVPEIKVFVRKSILLYLRYHVLGLMTPKSASSLLF